MQTQIDNLPEPLTKFAHFQINAFATDSGRDLKVIEYRSDGPMIMEVCKRAGDSGEGSVSLHHVEDSVRFFMSEDFIPECRTMGADAGEHIRVSVLADAGFIDVASVKAEISIRTTPGSVIIFSEIPL